MIIKVLVENNKISNNLKKKHGLSLYIESNDQKLLFDLGPNNCFYHNAKKMAINIKDIDTVVISHGHHDHGGGLKSFFKYNRQATVYIHPDAFKNHYTKLCRRFKVNVGLDKSLENRRQITFTSDLYEINPEITLFTTNIVRFPSSPMNDSLYVSEDNIDCKDTFSHEQSLIIEEDGKLFLFAGCAHRGIVNIIEQAKRIKKRDIDFVFSGFHLYNPISKKMVSTNYIEQLQTELSKTNATYYTCHCTGFNSYLNLKKNLEDKLQYIETGRELKL